MSPMNQKLSYVTENYIHVINPWNGEELDRIKIDTPRKVKEKIYRISETPIMKADDRIEYLIQFGGWLKKSHRELASITAKESGVPLGSIDIRMNIISNKYSATEEYAEGILSTKYGNNWKKVLDGEWIPDPVFTREGEEPKYFIRKKPKGVWGLFAPSNDSIGITLITAFDLLLGGNKVIVKPATRMPLGTIKSIEKMKEIGFEGYIDYVNGPGKDMLDMMLASEKIDGIIFVGTSRQGKKVHKKCIDYGVNYLGEYEGNNMAFYLKDIDPYKAASSFTLNSSLYNGTACYSLKGGTKEGDKKEWEEFEEEIIRQGEKINKGIGDPTSPFTTIGPLISEKLVANAKKRIDCAVEKGAKVLVGGEPIENPNTGVYNIMPYTVLKDTEECEMLYDETPAPVAWIEKDFYKALEWAKLNETRNPVKGVEGRNGIRYIIETNDIERAKRISKEFKTGLFNLKGVGINPLQRWGGTGKSSTYDGFEFLLERCMDTQCLYYDNNLQYLQDMWDEVMISKNKKKS